MTNIEPHSGGWRVVIWISGVRHRLWLGKCSKSAASQIANHIESLRMSRELGLQPSGLASRWAAACGTRIKSRLLAMGLIEAETPSLQSAKSVFEFVTEYIESRSDWDDGTAKNRKNAANKLVAFLGHTTLMTDVTPGDCDRYSRFCLENHSESHAGKLVRDARQFFKAAIRDRLLAENPFEGIATSSAQDKGRELYVSANVIDSLIRMAPNAHYRAVLAAARHAGLRMPSELVKLKWSHIDFEAGQMTVTGKLNAKRTVPLYPEFRKYIDELFDQAEDGAQWVFTQARQSAAKTWRQTVLNLIEKSPHQPWPKLFQNLRASCRSDLLETYPEHVVNYWMGHSSAVGRKHYDRIPGHFFEQAARPHSGSDAGPDTGPVSGRISPHRDAERRS